MSQFNYFSLITGVCIGLSSAIFFKVMNIRSLFGFLTKTAKASLTVPLTGSEHFKMVMVVRTDLNMGKGKIAAQCCHAALGCYKKAEKRYPEYLTLWSSQGQPKIVVKLDPKDGEDMLYKLEREATQLGIPCKVIHDAGHTQVQSGTATCAGFGPAPTSLINKVTGELKLL